MFCKLSLDTKEYMKKFAKHKKCNENLEVRVFRKLLLDKVRAYKRQGRIDERNVEQRNSDGMGTFSWFSENVFEWTAHIKVYTRYNFMEGWIAVTRTTTLGQKPRRVSLLNKNYVVWRDKNHVPRIQTDTCIHRGASLSTGRVRDGCIECPYHGWKYTENSVIQSWSKVPEYFTNEFSTKDKDGLLWVRPVGLEGPEPPSVPHMYEDGFNTVWFETTIKQSAQLIIENGIDPCHASWVHANPLGFGNQSEKPTNVYHTKNTIEFDYVPNTQGISTKLFGIQTTMNFHKFVLPYTTWSDVTISGGKILTTYVTLCPVNEYETKMFVGFSQNFGIPSEVFILMGKAIVEQDRAILENIESTYRYKGIPGEHDELVEMYRKSIQRLVFR